MVMDSQQKERALLTISYILLGFIGLAQNPSLLPIYLVLGSIIIIELTFDKNQTWRIETIKNRKKSIILALTGYVIFLSSYIFLSPLIRKFLNLSSDSLVTSYSLTNVADAFANVNAVAMSNIAPTLADNILLTILTFVMLIPLFETWAFTKVYELLSELFPGFKTVSLKSFRTWMLITIISLSFMFYHLASKGITNNDALIMVFLFFVVSLGLVIYEGQILSAVLLHVFANAIAIFNLFNITLKDNPITIYLILGVSAIAFINSDKIKLLNRSFA